jgi:gliding motility-associated transport system permease protein
MRNIWTIAKREYDHYFITPIAYVVAFVILLILGFIFFAVVQSASQGALYGYQSVPSITVVMWWFAFLLMFGTPALTMRLLSEETRSGTIELLLTAPIRDYELVVGKWLGSLLFIVTLVATTLIYPIMLNGIVIGNFTLLSPLVTPGIDRQLLLSSYLGVILVAASYLALGVGISAVFTNQIAAFFVSLITFLGLFFLIGIPASILPSGGEFFNYMVMSTHFDNAFNAGSIKLTDVVYFVSLIALGLFTGTTAVEVRRWR